MADIDLSTDAGIATLTWDLAGRSTNVLSWPVIDRLGELIEAVLTDEGVRGVIMASAKPDFIVGADVGTFLADKDPARLFERVRRFHAILRRLETGGKPVVAAIRGAALGGGFEVALACHRRIAANGARTQIGFPEVTLGLLPGAGGTQRLPRLIGIAKALPLLLEGKRLNVQEAYAAGLIDEIVEEDALLDAARSWLDRAGAEDSIQPWDRKGAKLPGGSPSASGYGPAGMDWFIGKTAQLQAKHQGNSIAPLRILSCVYEGCQLGIESGLKAEARYFIECARSAESMNMIRTGFFAVGEASKGAARPKGIAASSLRKVGVLGAGMMGAGIAYACASAGLDVVLLDTDEGIASRGKDYARSRLEREVSSSRLQQGQADAILGRIEPTADFGALAGSDIVIEAVFEDRAIKAEATRRAEAVLGPQAVFGSNTSTLPIGGLAEASCRPDRFIGIHFFSPVDRMRLVEIIRGERTSDETLAVAIDLVQRLKKTPIVVKDSRGFYTSRVFMTYLHEGLALLAEGVLPPLIENGAARAGMPVGPLALADEVSLELLARLERQTAEDLGSAYVRPASSEVVERFIALGRTGRKAGAGIYEYGAAPKRLWSDLGRYFPLAQRQPGIDEIRQRLLYIQAIEAVRCLDEGIVADASDADVGAVLGWGFPLVHGGPISLIHTIGIEQFIIRCETLAERHGQRFEPPVSLRERAQSGNSFYPEEPRAAGGGGQ
jgi:3-hydroxyacyl-CoA dehydrogenase/enoyl-CoA hydratase/3-hydroxybutyryl-CoA epimerase